MFKKKLGRRKLLDDAIDFNCKIERKMVEQLKEFAAMESTHTGRIITAYELLRNALNFVFTDNERLREMFRRSRAVAAKRLKKKY